MFKNFQFFVENYPDHRYSHPWDQATSSARAQNEFANSINIARSESIRSVDMDCSLPANPAYASRSEESIEPVLVHRAGRADSDESNLNWNLNDLDVRYNPEDGRDDEDPSNFQALADIRESRV